MRRSRLWLPLSLLVLPLAGVAACEDTDTSGTGSLTFPDAGSLVVDATLPDVVDAEQADASVADASVLPTYPGFIGSETAGPHEDRCPDGQVMIGVSAGQVDTNFYAGAVTGFRTLCGTAVRPVGGAATVTIGAGSTVPATADPPRGVSVPPMVAEVTCPTNQVVVGFTGSFVTLDFPPMRDLVAAVLLRCATLSYDNGTFTVGTATTGAGVGGGGTNVGPFDCTPGTIARGTRVQSGDVLNSVEARCEPPIIP